MQAVLNPNGSGIDSKTELGRTPRFLVLPPVKTVALSSAEQASSRQQNPVGAICTAVSKIVNATHQHLASNSPHRHLDIDPEIPLCTLFRFKILQAFQGSGRLPDQIHISELAQGIRISWTSAASTSHGEL